MLLKRKYGIILLKWKGARGATVDKWQEPRYYQSMSIRRDQDPLSPGPLGSSSSSSSMASRTLNIK
jgi:hypothetical protein